MRKELVQVIGTFRNIKRSIPGSGGELAYRCLLNNPSYRLPASANQDRFIGFREIIRTWRRIRFPQKAYEKTDKGSPFAIISGTFRERQLITEYISRSSGNTIHLYFAKDHLQTDHKSSGWIIRWFFFSLSLAVKCFFSDRRANLALVIREVVEIASLLSWMKKFQIRHVYDFVPYEKDGNFLSLLLRENGITCTKVPSPGPLATHNKIILADEMIVSSPYQEEEITSFGETIKTGKITKWIPERAFTYIDKYLGAGPIENSNVIGFYSHGGWLRKKMDHADDGLNIGSAEAQLVKDLGEFLRKHERFSLVIFLHPKEKTNMESAADHYNNTLQISSDRYSFDAGPSSATFDFAGIGVGSFSTILYERMFCGFKTLFGNYGITGFPLKGSTLEKISFVSFQQLEALLLDNADRTAGEFFTRYNLRGYRFFEYPYFSHLQKTT